MIVVFVRVLVLYALIILAMRVMGKRQLGELEPTELVMAMVVSDLAAVPMQDMGIPLLMGVIPIVTLMSVSVLLSLFSMLSVKFRAVISGAPSIIVRDGRLLQREIRRNRLTADEVLESLRIQGVLDPSTVQYAVLEANGQLSVFLKASEKPVTAGMLGRDAEDCAMPRIVINDGRVLDGNLTGAGLDRAWLTAELARRGVQSPREVFLMTVDEKRKVYLALRREADR